MSNYDIQMQNAAAAFAGYDTSALAEQFGLEADENFLYLRFLTRPMRICRKTGQVIDLLSKAAAGFHCSMTVYDMLTNHYGKPILSGQWCSHKSFDAVRGGTLQTRLEIETNFPQLAGKKEVLLAASCKLGGKQIPSGDFAAELPLFDFFPVLVRYYDADEEFLPQLQLLWDANTTRYLRYETTYYASAAIISALLQDLEKGF